MTIDAATWITMVGQLSLSRVEQEVFRRFQEDPSGRQFLPLSEVLRNHNLADESLELLAQGVQDHPGFAVARVVLARELFQRGLILEAWSTIDKAPAPLADNVLAQKLRFKIAVLLGDEPGARSAMQLLKVQQGVDPESRKIFDQMDVEGILRAKDAFREDLAKRGMDLQLPQTQNVSEQISVSQELGGVQAEALVARGNRFILEYELDDATKKHVQNFHVVPLPEVFVSQGGEQSEGGSASHVELDSTTLAEIYAKQGFYSKALAIYMRLLRMAPHNDLLRLKVSEIARLEKEQRHEDLKINPVVYDRMEVTDLLDRQMRFMQSLLDKLDQG